MICFERRFNPGDTVRVVESVFFDCLNLYEGMDDRERVAILLDLLGRNGRPEKSWRTIGLGAAAFRPCSHYH